MRIRSLEEPGDGFLAPAPSEGHYIRYSHYLNGFCEVLSTVGHGEVSEGLSGVGRLSSEQPASCIGDPVYAM